VIGLIPWRAVLALAYMGGIFWLSSLSASRVAALGIPAELVNLAHIPLFAGLGSVTLLALTGRTSMRIAFAVAIALAFALSDEWHQTFVPGRVFSLGDLGADALGVAIGIGAVLLVQAGGGGRPIERREAHE
jgi:VanZ family protein